MVWCLPTPTIEQAKNRRWYLMITCSLENLFFSALLFGWSALLFMIRKEKYYEHLCDFTDHHSNHTNATLMHGDNTSIHRYNNQTVSDEYQTDHHAAVRRLLSGGGLDDGTGCSAQATTLNLAYTIALFFMTGSSFVTGTLQDKFGYKPIRLGGSLLFVLGNLLMYSCSNVNVTLFIPGLVIMGVGGMTVAFTSLQIANLFGEIRSTILGILVGALSSSAIVFPIFKSFYDKGMPYSVTYIVLGIGGVIVFINCVLTWPKEVIPIPQELKARICMEQLNISAKKEGPKVKQLGRRMSEMKIYPYHNIYTSRFDLVSDDVDTGELSLIRIVFGPTFLLGLLFLAIMFLRVLLYIGAMYLELLKVTDSIETVSKYIDIFGYLQIICLPACPLFNMVLDRGIDLSMPEDYKYDEEHWSFQMKIQKMKNCMICFVLNILILVLFGVVVLIPNLELQILTFICHTIIRGTGQAAVLGLFAVSFPFQYLGKLLGLQILMSAVVDVVQSPLFIIIETTLHGDPTMIDIGLLAATFSAFSLPIYLVMHMKTLRKERMAKRKSLKSSDIERLINKGEPYAVQHFVKKDREVYV